MSLSPLPMPDGVRQYLHLRGITDSVIERFKVGYTEKKGGGWITIPVRGADGTVAFHKMRAVPGNTAPNKYAYDPSGAHSELYGRGLLGLPNLQQVVVCEGEFDAMLLISHNIAAVTSTSGAASFKEEWLDLFPKHCHVILCFDADKAGDAGRSKLLGLFRTKRSDCVLAHVRFSDFAKKGFDVTDFYLETGEDGFAPSFLSRITPEEEGVITDSPKDGKDEVQSKPGVSKEDGDTPDRITIPGKSRTFARVPDPTRSIPLNEWKSIIEENFQDLSFAAEACASVIAQLLIHDVHNPFPLILIDAASSGKTICIDFFSELKDIAYATDDFTPAAFVTNIAARSKDQLAQIDLLPRIRHKTLLVREMGVMLSEGEDELRQRIGQLTRVLDGDGYITESGVYGQRGYKGEYTFMMIGASLPFPLRIWKIMSGKGHRLYFLSIGARDKTEEDLLSQMKGKPFKAKQRECQAATNDFIYGLWKANPEGIVWDYEHDNEDCLRWISRFALMLRRLRGEIRVWTEDDTSGAKVTGSLPEIEDPSRINTCLYNLAKGHAVLRGQKSISLEDIGVVARVALDTCEETRRRLMRFLLNNNGQASVSDVMRAMQVSQHTAEKECEKFIRLGLCEGEIEQNLMESPNGGFLPSSGRPKNVIVLKQEFMWMCNDESIVGLLEYVSVIK